MTTRSQAGYLYEAYGAFYVRYYRSEMVDGKLARVQRAHRLCARDKNGANHSATCKAVKDKCAEFMLKVNAAKIMARDMQVAAFWSEHYLKHCEEIMKNGQGRKRASTIRGYKQVWNQHLKGHFGDLLLSQYEAEIGASFLDSLTAKQGVNSLKHIKALGHSIFARAVTERRIKANPWSAVKIPEDAVVTETEHYTRMESENIISALRERADCQLVMALACFEGLRPGEIAALRWEDVDEEWIHIRRNVVRGVIGAPKTASSIAPVVVVPVVRVLLDLWRSKSGNPTEGWVFPNRSGDKPVDLHNLNALTIKPMLKAAGVAWKGLYAGRRGACTMIIESTGGNAAVAQAQLRHKSMQTTLAIYKKAISPTGFQAGMAMAFPALKP
jgi:integrase